MGALPATRCEATRPAPCICCGADAWAVHYRILKKCAACGFVRAGIEPTHEEIRRLYQEGYFSGAEEYGDYLADADGHRVNFRERLRMVRRAMGRPRSVFEVGCAYGFWLEQCSLAGIPCAGVDVCAEAVKHARMGLGQDARLGDFLSLPAEPGAYQAFCMWDTIEHLAEPEAFVRRIHGLLPPGGWLFLTTGDIGSMYASWRGPRWRLIHPPTHLHYFSADTIRLLLAREGFRVMRCRPLPMYRSVGETLGRLANLGKGAWRPLGAALLALSPGWVRRLGFWLDLGDIMFVAARKAD
jgi:SAM-dependent methyltransferase